MSNPMYVHTSGIPVQSARGLSTAVRGEFDLVEDGFDLAAPLASPALTGTPTVPTAAVGTATTQAASTAFVGAAVTNTFGASYTNSTGTSAQSKTMAVASFTWTDVQTGLNFVAGMNVVAYNSDSNYMIGVVTAYSGSSLTINVLAYAGSGALSTWSFFAAVWYREVPIVSKSAAYTTVLSDSGKNILHPSADTTARIFTIDSNANVAYPIGTVITITNQASAGTLTVKVTSDTQRLAGPGTTGDRTLTANGIATWVKLTATEWICSGTNLT